MFNGEEWRDIQGYEGYQVSSKGRVRSCPRCIVTASGKKVFYKGKILKQVFNSNGYLFVGLYKSKKQHPLTVHRLVAFAFPDICGEYFPGAQVDHINTMKTDNTPSNLRWVTASDNMNNPVTKRHRFETNLKMKKEYRGTKHNCKVVEMMSMSGDLIKTFESLKEASTETGINYVLISKACRNNAGGYRWRFKKI